MRGDRHILRCTLSFHLTPTLSIPLSPLPVFHCIATVHTGNTEGSLAGKMSTICLHCRVVMLILFLRYLQRASVLLLVGLLISVCYKCVTSYSSTDSVNNQSKSSQWKSQEKWVHCTILLVYSAVLDSGFYVSVGPIHPVPKIRGGPTLGSRSFFSGLGSFIKP